MKRSRIFIQGLALLIAIWSISTSPGRAQPPVISLTYYGITWTFGSPVVTGTFADGEPWVVGPVTITDINPSSAHGDATNNGSMVNPVPVPVVFGTFSGQGFTSGYTAYVWNLEYVPSLNVSLSLPITLSASNTLVSSLTQDLNNQCVIETVALTVLSVVPPAGCFRPPVYGHIDKSIKFHISQINTSFLPSFTPTSFAPSSSAIQAILPALPWVELVDSFYGGTFAPCQNEATGIIGTTGFQSTYGREIAFKWGEVGLWLCLNENPAIKQQSIIQTIQDGIDIAGFLDAGGGFTADGGNRCGRKFPVLFAACALNDPHLLSLANQANLFQEDQQTFLVQQSDVGRPVNPPGTTYTQSMVGIPDWGIKHSFAPQDDDSRYYNGVAYRFVVWPAMLGPSLAADLMGLRSKWGPVAIFDYNQRYAILSGIPTNTFWGQMWSTYRKSPAPPQNVHFGGQ